MLSPQPQMLKRLAHKPSPQTAIRCKHRMATSKAATMPLETFLHEISEVFGTPHCTMCEWLTGDAFTKLVLDFDLENKDSPGEPFNTEKEKQIRKHVKNGAMSIIGELERQIGDGWEARLVWQERSGVLPNKNHKISIHVMVMNAFLPWTRWGDFVKATNPPNSEIGKKIFDESIYSKGRCMVIPGACKGIKGDHRILIVCHSDKPEDSTPHPRSQSQQYVNECLISYVTAPDDDVVFLEWLPTSNTSVERPLKSRRILKTAQNPSEHSTEEKCEAPQKIQTLLNTSVGPGHTFSKEETKAGDSDRSFYFTNDKVRVCVHGQRHESNHCYVYLKPDGKLIYLCLAPECHQRGAQEVGTCTDLSQTQETDIEVPKMHKFTAKAIAHILALDEEPTRIYEKYLRHLMNRHFAVITESKTFFLEIIYKSDTDIRDVVIRKQADFQAAFENLVHQPTGKRFLQMWLKDSERRTYSKIVYQIDSSQMHTDHFNLFLGFEIEHQFTKATISSHPDSLTLMQEIKPILDHVTLLCNGDETTALYIHKYMATILQRKGKTGVAMVFVSQPGTGKGMYINQFIGEKILGNQAYLQVSDVDKIMGRFNSCARGKVLINLDEVTDRGLAYSLSDKFKSYITEPYQVFEAKGRDADREPDFANYVITTNNSTPVKVEKGDRRYFVVECAEPPDKEYFDRLASAIQDPKVALRYTQFLHSQNLSNFHPQRDRPITEIYKDMADRSKPIPVVFVCWLLHQRKIDGVSEVRMYNQDLYKLYQQWREQEDPTSRCLSSKNLMMDLNQHGLTKSAKGTGNKPCKIFPPHLKEYLVEKHWFSN